MANLWDNNEIQFARLLCEIQANVAGTSSEWVALCESMDLTQKDVDSLFNRALIVWEKSKSSVINKNRKKTSS